MAAPARLAQWRASPRASRLPLFAAAWLLSCGAFFAVSASQLPSYYLPLLPAVALLAAHYFTHVAPRLVACDDATAPLLPAALAVAFGAGAAALAALPAMLSASPDAFTARIGRALVTAGVGPAGGISLGIAAAAAALAAAVLLAPRRWRTRTWDLAALRAPAAACALGMALLLTTVFTPALSVVDAARQQPMRALAASARQHQRSGRDLIAFAGPTMPSVVWYARQPVAFFHTATEAVRVARAEASPGVASVLLIAEDGSLRAARGAGGAAQRIGPALAEEGGFTLVRVWPQ